ncbi:Spy/CpxP family protein refolding chaperone [Xanthobacteraceae bacterium A53D]
MKSTVSRLLAASVLGTALVAGSGAMAQQAAPAAPAAGQNAPHVIVDANAYSDADSQAILNARLAALKTVIVLTPEQEKLWPAVETAIRDINKNAIARRKAFETGQPPRDMLSALGVMADAEAARAADLKKFVDAAKPFVASLTDAQKRRVPAFLGMRDTGGPAQPIGTLWLFEEEAG